MLKFAQVTLALVLLVLATGCETTSRIEIRQVVNAQADAALQPNSRYGVMVLQMQGSLDRFARTADGLGTSGDNLGFSDILSIKADDAKYAGASAKFEKLKATALDVIKRVSAQTSEESAALGKFFDRSTIPDKVAVSKADILREVLVARATIHDGRSQLHQLYMQYQNFKNEHQQDAAQGDSALQFKLASEEKQAIVDARIMKKDGNKGLFALCISGGGIRSATFSLGLIQALAKKKDVPPFFKGLDLAGKSLLDRVDYLSTVSEGGWIGSWLIAWIHRMGKEKVVTDLQAKGAAEPEAIRHLRQHSQYLTPQMGLLSGDT